ncbi:hypothetical protein GCM10011331_22750 [Flavimobilis marinus]|uniref:Flagellar assembly protein FliH n=1 Tax=Flavimobilis marinus TaxID=285351 RepID=A0A1I2GP34_9MICO|nr:FliH/SctL family protein [Flavimobilis marinus]GHG55812.1 hypothetical protein GCM10011331_22750 [Flavimobilis marinus]SFF19222.1 flagellar assembly protein FliH [Flavimobilis marinus]
MSAETTEARFTAARLTVLGDDRSREARERGRVAGYAAGWAEGSRAAVAAAETQAAQLAARDRENRAHAAARVEAATATLRLAAQAADERALQGLETARGTLATLALELARAVVGHELSRDGFSARSALVRALAVPDDVVVHTIRMNPDDLATLTALRAADELDVVLPTDVRLVADATLAAGDAVSEFPGGYLDAQISTAFDRAAAALTEALAHDAVTLRVDPQVAEALRLAELDASLPEGRDR